MFSLKINKRLKIAKTGFKEKAIYLFSYLLFLTLSLLNELFIRIENLFKNSSKTDSFYLNQDEELYSNITDINTLRETRTTKKNKNLERA